MANTAILTAYDEIFKEVVHDENEYVEKKADVLYGRIKKEKPADGFGKTMRFPIQTVFDEAAVGTLYTDTLQDGNDPDWDQFEVTATLMTSRFKNYDLEIATVNQSNSALIKLLTKRFTQCLSGAAEQMDDAAILSSGAVIRGWVAANVTAGSNTAITFKWQKNDTDAYAGEIGVYFFRVGGYYIFYDTNSSAFIGSTAHKCTAVSRSAGTATFDTVPDITASHGVFAVKCNNNAPTTSNDYQEGMMGVMGIVDDHNGTIYGARHSAKFQNITRSAAKPYANGKVFKPSDFGAADDYHTADLTEDILIQLTEWAGTQIDNEDKYADDLLMNKQTLNHVYDIIKDTHLFTNRRPDTLGVADPGKWDINGIKPRVKARMPDGHIFALNYDSIKYMYLIPLQWNDRQGAGRLLPESDKLMLSASCWTFGDYVSPAPYLNARLYGADSQARA
jgi:hypothetical protein